MGKHKLYGHRLERARRLVDLGVPMKDVARELRVKPWRVHATVGMERRLAEKELLRARLAAGREAAARERLRREVSPPATEPTMRELLKPPVPTRVQLGYERREIAARVKKARQSGQ